MTLNLTDAHKLMRGAVIAERQAAAPSTSTDAWLLRMSGRNGPSAGQGAPSASQAPVSAKVSAPAADLDDLLGLESAAAPVEKVGTGFGG